MRSWYGIAVGGLGWSPKTFWKATIAEFFMALEGHNETHRIKPKPMTRAEFEALAEDHPPSGSIRKMPHADRR